MNRTLFVATIASIFVGCNLSQDLGSSADLDAGTVQDGSTANTDIGSSTKDSGTQPKADSGSSGGIDSGPDAKVIQACPIIAGYEAAPYMKYTITGDTYLAGTYEESDVVAPNPKGYVLAGHFSGNAAQADYDSFLLANVSRFPQQVGNQFVGPEWFMALMTRESAGWFSPGTTYPITIRPVGALVPVQGPLGATRDSAASLPTTLAEDQKFRYPGTGPGSCSLTVDFASEPTNNACLNARFSCTGLVGKGTGKAFEVIEGKISYASSKGQ